MAPEKTCILIVDDASENIDVLRSILGDEYRIKVALNGKKALDLAKKDPKPDLILLDVMMPEIDGICYPSVLLMEEGLNAAIKYDVVDNGIIKLKTAYRKTMKKV